MNDANLGRAVAAYVRQHVAPLEKRIADLESKLAEREDKRWSLFRRGTRP